MNKLFGTMVAAAIFAGAMTAPALAANFDVKMLNKGEAGAMVFEPALTKIAVGDTVTFVPVDKGHNAETILDMIPASAATWKGKTNEQFTVTLTEPGLYGFMCMPHFSMGMVGLIQVGDDRSNLTQLMNVRLPGRAQARMMELFARTSP